MHVRRPRGEEPDGWPSTDYQHTGGHINGLEHPWEWSADEAERMAAELAEQLARKRPPGFAPWPDPPLS